MELENEQESNDLSSKLSDISENEDELPIKEIENEDDELPVRGIANLYSKLSNKIESAGPGSKVSETEDEKPVKGIANLYRKLSSKIGNEVEIKKSTKLDLGKNNVSENIEKKNEVNHSKKNTAGNGVSNLGTDKTSNSVLSDVSKNESDEDEPGLILSDDEEKVRKQNHLYSIPLSQDVKERHTYDYKSMCPPRYTTNIYRSSESNYPDAFHVRERITSKDGGSYVRYTEYDDSSYFSQSEPNAHRDYSEELEYYKYRDIKRRGSIDREYYDDHTSEKRRDHRKKDRRKSKKSRKDKEVSDNDDIYERESKKRKYEDKGSHNKLDSEYDERPTSKRTYEAERKSRRRRRRKNSSSYEDMSDCIIEADLRDVRKKRSKKGKKYEKEISIIDSSEEDYESEEQERYSRSKKSCSKERYRSRKRSISKAERGLERTSHKTDVYTIDSEARIDDEHKISEHRKEKKLNEFKEKTIPKSENVSSSKISDSNHDAALWVTLQNMAKVHNEKFKEFRTNPLKYPNYKEEYDLFSKLHAEKKSEFGESSKELDLDQEFRELYWPKRLNEIVKEKWVTKKEEFIQNQNSMKLYLEEQKSSSIKPLTKENIKCLDESRKQDDKKIKKNPSTNDTQLSAHLSTGVNMATKVSNMELKSDLVIETVPVNKENSLQQSNSSHKVNQSCTENVKKEVLEGNVSTAPSTVKEKVPAVDDGIVWLLKFLLTLKEYLASLIGPIEGLYNEAIELQNKGVSPIKILEDSGHKMVIQLVVNKFVTIINSDNLSMGEKTLYGRIMEQLNNLINGENQIKIGTKQQVECKDDKNIIKEETYVGNIDNRKVQMAPQNNNQIKKEDTFVFNDYTHKAQVDSQNDQINCNKGDNYNPINYNHKAQVEVHDYGNYNRDNSYEFKNYNLKEQIESQHSHINHQSFNNHNFYNFNDYNRNAQIEASQIKEEPSRSYNRNDTWEFQDYNHRIKEEYHTSIIQEDPYIYKDYNRMRDNYQENISKQHANDIQNDRNYHRIQETGQNREFQDLNDEEIDHIARKTMGRNSDEMIKFIEHSLEYKGINVESKEKLRSIFMSVREKQFGIIGS